MRKNILIFSVFVVLVALLSVSLVACNNSSHSDAQQDTGDAHASTYQVIVENGWIEGYEDYYNPSDSANFMRFFANNSTLTAKTDVNVEGKRFLGWYIGGVRVSTEATYTFTVTKFTTLIASYETLCKLTVEGGTINNSTDVQAYYSSGSIVTVVAATPAFGTEFNGWYVGSVFKSAVTTYTFNISQNTIVTARFTPIGGGLDRYTVSVVGGYIDDGSGGNLTSGVYLENYSLTIYPTVPAGKLFDCWTIDSTSSSYENPLSLQVRGNTNIVANFIDAPPATMHSLFVYGGVLLGDYELDGDGGYLIAENTALTIRATVSQNQAFNHWELNGNELASADETYSFTLTGDCEFIAYNDIVYDLTVTNGSVSKLNSDVVSEQAEFYLSGSVMTVQADVPQNKVFVCWIDTDTHESLGSDLEYTFELNHDTGVTAVLNDVPSSDKKSVTIVGGTLYADIAASAVKGDGVTAEYSVGDYIYYKTNAKEDWTTSAVGSIFNGNSFETRTHNVNGVNSQLVDASYADNIVIFVRFAQTCTLLVESGTINGGAQSSATFNRGDVITVEPKTITGKDFRHWEIDGVPVPATEIGIDLNGNALSNPNAFCFRLYDNLTIGAVYNTVYTVSVQNGTIVKSGETDLTTDTVYSHGQVTVKANEIEGKVFKKWQVNYEVKSTSSTYTFRVLNNCEVVAIYNDLYEVKVINNSGSIVVDGEDCGNSVLCEAGESITLIALEKEGKAFKYWQRNGIKVPGSTETYVRIISSAAEWEAVYEQLCHVTVTEGAITIDGTAKGNDVYVDSGISVTVTAEEKEGYVFSKWVVAGNDVSNNREYTFDVTSDISLSAVYVEEVVLTLINAVAGDGTTSTISYGKGTQATATATLPLDKAFSHWSVGTIAGAEVSRSNPYSFIIQSDTTLYANYTDSFVVTFGLRCNGATVGTDVQYNYRFNNRPLFSTLSSSSSTMKNVVPENYHIQSWSVNGEIVRAQSGDDSNFVGAELEQAIITNTTVIVNLIQLHLVSIGSGEIYLDGISYGTSSYFEAGTTGIELRANVDANGRSLSDKKLFVSWVTTDANRTVVSTDYNYKLQGALNEDVKLQSVFGFVYSQTVPDAIDSVSNISKYAEYYDGGNANDISFVYPGLAEGENVVISGISYYEQKNWMILGGYISPTDNLHTGNSKSMLFVIDLSQKDSLGNPGKMIKEMMLHYADGSGFYGQINGIAVTDKSIFVANEDRLYRVAISELDRPSSTLTVKFIASTGSNTEVIQLPVNADFCSFDSVNNVLWVGESKADTESHQDQFGHTAWTVGYVLDESGADGFNSNGFKTAAFANQGSNIYDGVCPDYVLCHGDDVQGIAIAGNKIVTTKSDAVSNVSSINIYENPFAAGKANDAMVTINDIGVSCWYLDEGTSITAPPMAQNITTLYNDTTGFYYVAVSSDSACVSNRSDTSSVDPVAVAWQYKIIQ